MRLIPVIGWALVIASSLVSIIGRFGEQCDACDLANIGHAYWFILAACGMVIIITHHLYGRRSKRHIFAAALLSSVAIDFDRIPVAPHCQSAVQGQTLRIVSFNAWAANRNPSAAAAWIRAQHPDVAIMVEIKGTSAALPAMLADILPYQASCLPRGRCSTQILSAFAPGEIIPMARGDVENRKTLSAVAMRWRMMSSIPTTIVAVHLSRPLPLGQQRTELAKLHDRLRRFDSRSLIVAGDFNATTHNASLAGFARELKLRSAVSGATWPTTPSHRGAPSLIDIDHILVGPNMKLLEGKVGPVIGSDHRPVTATLCLQ